MTHCICKVLNKVPVIISTKYITVYQIYNSLKVKVKVIQSCPNSLPPHGL